MERGKEHLLFLCSGFHTDTNRVINESFKASINYSLELKQSRPAAALLEADVLMLLLLSPIITLFEFPHLMSCFVFYYFLSSALLLHLFFHKSLNCKMFEIRTPFFKQHFIQYRYIIKSASQ